MRNFFLLKVLFLACSCGAYLFSNELEVLPVPLWIDYETLFQPSDAEAKEYSRPLVMQGLSYRVDYAFGKESHRVEKITLTRAKTSVPEAQATLCWEGDRLTLLRVVDKEGRVQFSDRSSYAPSGSMSTRACDYTMDEKPCSRRWYFDEAGRLKKERTITPEGKKILRLWAWDEKGKLLKEKEEIFNGRDSNEPLRSDEIFFGADGITRKEIKSRHNKQASGEMRLSWKCDEAKHVSWIERISKKDTARRTSFEYDSAGRLAKKIKPDGVFISYGYDREGRLSRVLSSDSSCDYTLTYDDHGRCVAAESPNGGSFSRTYSEDGRITQEVMDGIALSMQYTSWGSRDLLILPDRSCLKYVYEGQRCRTLTRFDSKGTLSFEYDIPMRDVLITEEKGPQSMAIKVRDPLGEATNRVHYDQFGQVDREEGSFSHEYHFDSLGNLLQKDGMETLSNEWNEIISDGRARYEYDINGNLVAKILDGRRLSYSYDALDRLTTISEDGRVVDHYTYDLFSRRTSSASAHFLWDGFEEIGRMSLGKIDALKIRARDALVIELGGHPYVASQDKRGSIIALLDLTTKTPREIYRYSAFGEEKIFDARGSTCFRSKLGNPWGFCSKSRVEEAGLIYFGARFYDPKIASWLSCDPLGYIDGPNTKAFVANDPMNFVDPTGLFAIPVEVSALGSEAADFFRKVARRAYTFLPTNPMKRSWFDDFRPYFEGAAFKLADADFWTRIGYNPDPTSVLVTDDQEASDKVRITLINGILNTYSSVTENATTISRYHGNVAVHYLYSASAGFTADLLHAFFAEIGFVTKQARLLADTWKKLIADMGGPGKGGMIIHYAHSLGAGDTYRALQLLTPAEKKMIRITTFGSPFLIQNDGCGDVLNYVASHDPVPWFDVVGYVKAFFGHRDNVHFIPSKARLEHLLDSEAYGSKLQELGKKFQEEHRRFLAKGDVKKIEKNALSAQEAAEKIRRCLNARDFFGAGKVLEEAVPKPLALRDIEQIAEEVHSVSLARAALASRNITKLDPELGLKIGQLLRLCLFMETDMEKYIVERKFYLREHETGLPRTCEYDPKSKHRFIHLGTRNIPKIGKGYHKVVTKSILYDPLAPEICANCVTGTEDKKEMAIMEQLQGTPGIVEGRAFITHSTKRDGENRLEIICKLYNCKSLREIYYSKTPHFSLWEKMKIALDLLSGLAGMHEQKLVHRDLHSGNYLVDLTRPSKGPREVNAAIIDFGKTLPEKKCANMTVQAAHKYVAPEGFIPWKLRKKDYYATDVYALGCVLYQVFFEKDPPWFDDKFFKGNARSGTCCKKAAEKLKGFLEKMTSAKEQLFLQKKLLSPGERFEALIWKMVRPDHDVRPSASLLRDEMRTIYSAACTSG
jgi:RHS repeat-associated protein